MADSDRMQARKRVKQLAAEFTKKGDPTGWFEVLYKAAQGNEEGIPWAEMTASPLLIEWATRYNLRGEGKRALVVGCGLGEDAEAIARLGFTVTAFDISPTAINWCQRRFPTSQVHYTVADVLKLPEEWSQHFDFIVEIFTLQSLPDDELRNQATANLARCVAPGGSLLVICRGRDPDEDRGTMPWPLTRLELTAFQRYGLREVALEDFMDREEPPVRRFRALYRV
ncbi:MAG TPA: class I SAM-dependent methyltransferase [Ktedonosporobacter sp.]|nr:class I SAM-dependent methyltransferase [Ktedonosporobacter sp.]